MIDKALIYKQIKDFNAKPFNPSVLNSTTVEQSYLYINDGTANDAALFLQYLKAEETAFSDWENKTDLNVLDMASGSGNLTSHLVLENFKDFEKITLNDLNDEANKDVIKHFPDGKATFSKYDFLDLSQWKNVAKADLIVFNPQIGGNYTKGISKIEKVSTVFSENELEDFLIEKGIDTANLNITQDETERKILIQSEELSKTELQKIQKEVKIFNYYDVFIQAKQTKEEGSKSNIVKFRQILDKISYSTSWLIFYGEVSVFESLFADFDTVFDYWIGGVKTGSHIIIASKQDFSGKKCFEKSGNTFVEIPNCEKDSSFSDDDADISALEQEIKATIQELYQKETTASLPISKEEKKMTNNTQSFEIQQVASFGNVNFPYKNILLKGVPGTGKSRLINENLIKKQLGFGSITHENILRINIHSASSNADLMQGIGISANKGQVEYSEKQGLILNHLKKAIASPFQPFVIVLEEIQENSLNELIGDLIYLIEDDKRVDIQAFVKENGAQSYESIEHFFDALCAWKADLHFVEIPYLIDAQTKYRKLVVPKNLFFFCTSNYRDDKKIIEDNLLRRFELIEIYPKYDSEVIDNQEVAAFLQLLNETIVTQFKDSEIHPDRFMIGHAAWIKVSDEQSFCRALLKAITEFKDIREIEFSTLKPILEVVKKELPFGLDKSLLEGNYKNVIEQLQAKAYSDIL